MEKYKNAEKMHIDEVIFILLYYQAFKEVDYV